MVADCLHNNNTMTVFSENKKTDNTPVRNYEVFNDTNEYKSKTQRSKDLLMQIKTNEDYMPSHESTP